MWSLCLAYCFQDSFLLYHALIWHSFLFFNNIPLFGHTTFCIYINQFLDICIFSTSKLLLMMFPQTLGICVNMFQVLSGEICKRLFLGTCPGTWPGLILSWPYVLLALFKPCPGITCHMYPMPVLPGSFCPMPVHTHTHTNQAPHVHGAHLTEIYMQGLLSHHLTHSTQSR
jgi:hypothetical protein